MAYIDKGTKRRVGPDVRQPGAARDSGIPSSSTRDSRSPSVASPSSRRDMKTQQGMPIRQKKIVTKSGMAPPPSCEELAALEELRSAELGRSEPSSLEKATNPGMTPPPPLAELQMESDGYPSPPRGRFAAAEDITPAEGSNLKDAGLSSSDRSRFRTAPGGGRNRISGGREHAAAYVSPATVPPGTGTTPVTAAIKVDQIVRNAARAYQTEPSLMRRRASSLPGEIPEPRHGGILFWGGAVVGLAFAVGLIWFGLSHAPPRAQKSSNETEQVVAVDEPSVRKATDSRNNASDRTKRGVEEEKPSSVAGEPAEKSVQVASPVAKTTISSPKKTKAKAPVAPPQPPKEPDPPAASPKKSNDLWLE